MYRIKNMIPDQSEGLVIENELGKLQELFYDMERELDRYRSLENIKPMADLSSIIRHERKKQKLTLKSLSELSGISYASLSKIESGDTNFNYRTLKSLTDTLGLKLWIG